MFVYVYLSRSLKQMARFRNIFWFIDGHFNGLSGGILNGLSKNTRNRRILFYLNYLDFLGIELVRS